MAGNEELAWSAAWFSIRNVSAAFHYLPKAMRHWEEVLGELLRWKADTAGCREPFKLAELLSPRHKNKQFNHSSLNLFWHVARSHWEEVTFFLWGAAGGRTSLTRIIWRAGQELSRTPASPFKPLCYIKWTELPGWQDFFFCLFFADLGGSGDGSCLRRSVCVSEKTNGAFSISKSATIMDSA